MGDPRDDRGVGPAQTLGIGEVLYALRRGWPLVFGCALMAWAIVYSAAGNNESLYRSDARLLLAPAALQETRDLIDTSAGLERESVTTTLAEVMTGTEMRARLESARTADIDLSEYTVESATQPVSNLVTLSVTGPDADDARRIAVVLVASTTTYFESLYPIYRVDQVDAPSLPEGRVSPTPARDGAIAAFGGATLGLAIVLGVWGWRRQEEPDATSPLPVDDPIARWALEALTDRPVLVEVPPIVDADQEAEPEPEPEPEGTDEREAVVDDSADSAPSAKTTPRRQPRRRPPNRKLPPDGDAKSGPDESAKPAAAAGG